MVFGCQSSFIHTSVDIHIDIQAGVSMQGHYAIDIRKQQISMNGFPCFMDISFQLSMFYGYPFVYPWISMDIHALTCYGF